MNSHDPQSVNFEANMKELELILKKLESGDVGIDESIHLYERGISLKKVCEEKLQQAQLKIHKMIQEQDGNLVAKPAPELDKS